MPISKIIQVPQEREPAMRKLAELCASSDPYPRIDEIVRATTSRFYWRGDFDSYFNSTQMSWSYPDSRDGDEPLHYCLNIYQQYGRGFISQVGIAPRIRFEAKDIQNPSLASLASEAEEFRKKIESTNDVDDLSVDAARYMWTDGPLLIYTRYMEDGARFGRDEDGKPKAGVKMDVYAILEGKRPIDVRSISSMPYLQIAVEIDMGSAQSMLKGVRPSPIPPGENGFDRISRLSVVQGTRLLSPASDTGAEMPTWQRTWARPAMYWRLSKEDRTWLDNEAPHGVLISYIGDQFHEARAESMDDHLTICYPISGDGQSTPAAGMQVMDAQDLVNDLADLFAEAAFKAIPAVYGDKGLIDFAAISKQKAGPGQHWPTKRVMQPDEKMADRFWSEPAADLPPSVQLMFQALLTQIPQGLTGLYPAVLGDTDPAAQTKGGLLAIRDASRGQQGPAWRNWRKAYRRAIIQGVRMCFEAEKSELAEQFTASSETICVHGDESFPQTEIEKREMFQQIVTEAIQGSQQAAAVLADAQNAVVIKRYLGLPDLRIPGLDEAEKQMSEIAILLQATPISDPQTGQLRPSLGIDPDTDDHAVEWQRGLDWMNSPDGQAEKEKNPEGVMNVKMHLLLHRNELQKRQEAQQQTQLTTAATIERIKHPQPGPKAPSISMNVKDMGPSERIQAFRKAGIDGSADEGESMATDTAAARAPRQFPQIVPPGGVNGFNSPVVAPR